MTCPAASHDLLAALLSQPQFLLAVLAPFIIFPLVMTVLSRAGGWASLAELYPQAGTPPPPLTRIGYCVFRRWCGYNGCLIICTDQMGLYLRLWPVFSLWHAPVFIPWSEIREIRRESMWGRPIYRLVTARAPELHFALHGRTWEAVRPHAEAARVSIVES
jgi:hypothetical protein